MIMLITHSGSLCVWLWIENTILEEFFSKNEAKRGEKIDRIDVRGENEEEEMKRWKRSRWREWKKSFFDFGEPGGWLMAMVNADGGGGQSSRWPKQQQAQQPYLYLFFKLILIIIIIFQLMMMGHIFILFFGHNKEENQIKIYLDWAKRKRDFDFLVSFKIRRVVICLVV